MVRFICGGGGNYNSYDFKNSKNFKNSQKGRGYQNIMLVKIKFPTSGVILNRSYASLTKTDQYNFTSIADQLPKQSRQL